MGSDAGALVARSPKARVTALMLFCLAFAAALLARAGWIQLAHDRRLETMARRQFQSKVLVRPSRGSILDRNGEPLAINVETSSLAANPSKIENPRTLTRLLAKATDIPYATLVKKLVAPEGERSKEKREFVWIKRHMSEAEVNRFRKWRVIDSDGELAQGLFLVKESQRVYPHGEMASHVLGDVNIDSEGVEGTELWMNDKLRGKVTSVTAIKDALGRPTFIDAVAAKQVQDGEPVSLTIDASLQFAVEQELKNALHKSQARSGSVIVMNAVSGEILAMANQPSFNPNEKNIPLDRRRNRALTDGYEPGSTMKAVLISAALSHGWKLSDQVWGERGKLVVQGHKISEAEAHEKFEWISLKKLIQVSSNVGAAKVALKLGADKYYAMLKAFGFGAKTDTGFPGEISGRVPPRKGWQPLSLANIGFGQGVLVTPMQMTRAYATFLNGGWLVQPTLLKTQQGAKVDPPRRIITQKVADEVLEALASVTEEGGTGVKANLTGYTVAGKTGTAQMVDPATGAYSRSKHIASFIGYALNVEPKVVIFTRVDEPHGIYYASETAAPLFREVLNAVANRFSMPSRAIAQAPLSGKQKVAARHDQIRLSQAKAEMGGNAPDLAVHWHGQMPDGTLQWKMPSLKGLTPREAMRALTGHKFQVEVHGSGVIRAQTPDEGKVIADGETIRLNLAEP